ncbi:MAG: F0F1 ATP synthase subunit A [Clostridium sp.]
MVSDVVLYSFDLFGFPVLITRDIVVQWVVIAVLGIIAYLLTRNLKRVPGKKQVALEYVYTTVKNLVVSNMGENYLSYIPYIGSLVIYLLVLNLLGLVGVIPPTQNINVTIALALSSFIVIQYTAIRRNGPLGYVKGIGEPYLLMAPLNIMERFILPVSLALRLFGNMLAATILLELLYEALGSIGPIAQLGLPIIAHGYFDVFDGSIQMLVFTMLTMINIKLTAEHH